MDREFLNLVVKMRDAQKVLADAERKTPGMKARAEAFEEMVDLKLEAIGSPVAIAQDMPFELVKP